MCMTNFLVDHMLMEDTEVLKQLSKILKLALKRKLGSIFLMLVPLPQEACALPKCSSLLILRNTCLHTTVINLYTQFSRICSK